MLLLGVLPKKNNPLYEYTKGKPKALLKMNGRTMLECVVKALQSAQQVDDIILVGLGDDRGQRFQRPVIHLPDQGSLVGNVLIGVDWIKEYKPDAKMILISSSDIPLLTGEMVDAYIEACHPFEHGVYYNFVTKKTMEARFPCSGRTFTRLKEVIVTGGDINLIQPTFPAGNRKLWEALAAGRKQAWKFALTVGPSVLFKLLTNRLSLADIEKLIQRFTNHSAKIILSPYAELAMDCDKPHQVDMLRKEFTQLKV